MKVLGPLEIEGPAPVSVPPTSNGARIVLVLFGLNETYTRQELVDILWQGDDVEDGDDAERRRINGKLDQVLKIARASLGAAGYRLSSKQKVVRLTRGLDAKTRISLEVDADDFYKNSQLHDETEAQAKLRLVRGRIGEALSLPSNNLLWLEKQRKTQERWMAHHIQLLLPDETNVDDAVSDVLARGYETLFARGLRTRVPVAVSSSPAQAVEQAETSLVDTEPPGPGYHFGWIRVAKSPRDYADWSVACEQNALQIDRIPKRISIVFKDPTTVEAIADARFGSGSGNIGHYVAEHELRRANFFASLKRGMQCRELYSTASLIEYIRSRRHASATLEVSLVRSTVARWMEALRSQPNYLVGLTTDAVPFKYSVIDRRTVIMHESIGVDDRHRVNAFFLVGDEVGTAFSDDFDLTWDRIPPAMRDRTKVLEWIETNLLPLCRATKKGKRT